ncbi:MFS transporter [Fodinicola feengrottensis]|uniref:MFS transporter n=1 Tax=Fodinicola feengrottensis TaxID=435914 RepID=UPI002441A254|nr:MFS transporter [Fodinicola feengrottensis]
MTLWGQAAILLLGGFASMFTSTVGTVTLDTVAHQLGAPLATAQWTVSGYLIAMATIVPASGWAAKRCGGKPIWLVAITLFGIFSAFCAVSTSVEMLIFSRVLLGLTAGLLVPVGQMMIAVAAGPHRMGRLMSIASIPLVLAPVLGSTAGSLLTRAYGWPWLFWINVPFAAVGLVAGLRWLKPAMKTSTGPLDVLGLALVLVGLPAIVYGVEQWAAGGTGGLESTVVGVVLLIISPYTRCVRAIRC